MSIFEWGEKRFSRGIARAIIRSYKLYKVNYPEESELKLIKRTLSDRPGIPASTILSDISDENFFNEIGGNLFNIIFILVRLEYVEYMNGTLDEENEKTNKVFKETILDEMNNNQILMTQPQEISKTMFDLSVYSAEKLRTHLNYPTIKEADIMWTYIVFEFLYLFMHLISRELFNNRVSITERKSVMDTIGSLTIDTSISTLYEDMPPDLVKGARNSFFEQAQSAELQYASCVELLSKDKPLDDKAVISRFGKNILKLTNTPENIEVHLVAVTLAMHAWTEIRKLLT